MAGAQLLKHPSESIQYGCDFATAVVPTPRGTLVGQNLLAAGESFGQGATLPLLLGTLVQSVPTPTITVSRSDGQASDLTVGASSVAGSQVLVVLAGGTSGLTYTVTVAMTSNKGNVRVLQWALLVTSTLP